MPKKNNLIFYILIELVFLFCILIIIPTLFLKEKPGINNISYKNTLPLDVNHSYIQKIILDKNNLNSISVLLKNFNLESNDLVDLEIQNNDNETVQSLRISGLGIEDPGWVRFKFPSINSKVGDIFYLKITSNSPENGRLYIYGDSNTKNINFKTTFTYKNTKESFQDNLKQQIDNFKSRNFFQNILYLILLTLTNIFIFI